MGDTSLKRSPDRSRDAIMTEINSTNPGGNYSFIQSIRACSITLAMSTARSRTGRQPSTCFASLPALSLWHG